MIIYTKDHCPYCSRAKSLLDEKGAAYSEIDLEHDPAGFAELKARTGMMTVPQIFINDQLIGGYQELRQLEREQKLDAILQADSSFR